MMNKDIQLYKERFLSIFLIISYTYLHAKLTGVYVEATLDQQIHFAARLPFGQRLLIPTLAHYLSNALSLKTNYTFFLFEWLSVCLLYWSLLKLLSLEFTMKQAKLLSWLFLLLLPLITVINYRYTVGGKATFFYVYDMPSMFFIALGLFCCLRQQWFLLLALIFVATLNRESSILLVLLIPALHLDKWRTLYKPISAAFFTYILARFIVFLVVYHLPGTWVEWYAQVPDITNFALNVWWLIDEQNYLMASYCFAGTILFWFAFYDFIPLQFRPIRYIALFYFIGLLFVGRVAEARIFCEIVVIMYLPLCIALQRWASDMPPQLTAAKGIAYYFDRYAVFGTLFILLVLRHLVNALILYTV